MSMTDLKRISYMVSGVLTNIEKGEVSVDDQKALRRVMEELKVIDAHTNPISKEMRLVTESDVKLYCKSLRSQETAWSIGCAEVIEKLWHNVKLTDKKLVTTD